MNYYLRIFLVGILAVSLFGSCKTLKNRNRNTNKNVLTLTQLYDSAQVPQVDYNYIAAKGNIKFKQGKKGMSLKCNLRILKDSIIWLSLSPGLGIEAARLKCTKDSVFVLDKLKKNYIKADYKYLKKLYKVDVDFYSLQAIFTNSFFIYPTVDDEKRAFSKQFKLLKDTSNIIAYRKTDKQLENKMVFSKTEYKITDYFVADIIKQQSMNIHYEKGDFEGIPYFPKSVDIKSTSAGKNFSVLLNFTKLTKNGKISLPFRVAPTYKTKIY